ncbi:MAG: hypothetical protein UZ06_CHB003000140 [Chlorobi bacterium OLB6]|nr:MAG: hypothetical protein UZ06_CHB003000140 [Chlorobi bacterium OLB6]
MGEIVAAVAAETEQAAAEACKRIVVQYKPLTAFTEIDASLNDIGDNEKIHEHCKFNNNVHKKQSCGLVTSSRDSMRQT